MVAVEAAAAVVATAVVAAGPDGAAGVVAAAADFLAGLDERGAWGALSDLGPPRT